MVWSYPCALKMRVFPAFCSRVGESPHFRFRPSTWKTKQCSRHFSQASLSSSFDVRRSSVERKRRAREASIKHIKPPSSSLLSPHSFAFDTTLAYDFHSSSSTSLNLLHSVASTALSIAFGNNNLSAFQNRGLGRVALPRDFGRAFSQGSETSA